MSEVIPIHDATRQLVVKEVQRYLLLASERYQRYFTVIPVVFDLRGRAAGMYKVHTQSLSPAKHRKLIRFNPWLFAKYPQDSWDNTIPHEVAHYIADCLHGFNNIKPHGKQWRQIMTDFGADPIVRANYSLEGIPHRHIRSFDYRCACRQMALSIHRHKKIQAGVRRYRCRNCSQLLERVG